MHRGDILDHAKTLTCGDRDKSYGDPKENHRDIAQGWSVLLGTPVTSHQVALCMAWVKMCRQKTSPRKMDHYADLAAYAAIAGECVDAE